MPVNSLPRWSVRIRVMVPIPCRRSVRVRNAGLCQFSVALDRFISEMSGEYVLEECLTFTHTRVHE